MQGPKERKISKLIALLFSLPTVYIPYRPNKLPQAKGTDQTCEASQFHL